MAMGRVVPLVTLLLAMNSTLHEGRRRRQTCRGVSGVNALHEGDRFGRGPLDASDEGVMGRTVLERRVGAVDARGRRDRADAGEQRPETMIDHEQMRWGSTCRDPDRRLVDEA